MPIFLEHLEGSKAGQVDTFDQDQLRIGRQPDNHLRFDPKVDAAVSGYHAEIYRDGSSYFIKDLQSRNGTFVNSRKVDRPVALKDGDTIQFSTRGPKAKFLTRDPSAAVEIKEVPAPENAPTEVFSAVIKKEVAESSSATIWERIRGYLPITVGAAVLIAAVAVGHFLMSIPWWTLLIAAAIIVLVGGGGYLAWRWWQRRKVAANQKQSVQRDQEISAGKGDKGNILDLKKKWAEVIKSLRESKLQRAGDDSLYAFPWYLVIGESGAGKSTLLKASGPQSSVASSGVDGATRNCDWWFFDKVVMLDTSGRYLALAKDSDGAAEWQELLNLLRTQREREPINGVIIALSADSIITKPIDRLKEEAAQIRERLDEVVQRLGIKFPVYLMITKTDRIAGFSEFFQLIPDQVKGQALGYANAELTNSHDAGRFFDRAFRTLCERLERVRLAILCDSDPAQPASGLYLFPAELRSLHAPLRAFIEALFRPSPYRDAPPFRGIFLTSARQGSAPLSRLAQLLEINYSPVAPANPSRTVFMRDLNSTILPGDRGLAGRTATGRDRLGMTRAAGVIVALAASLLICGLLTLSFTNNWLALSRLDAKSCTSKFASAEIANLTEILRPLDACRSTVESLLPTSLWSRMSSNFGLGYARKVGYALQEIFLREFQAQILGPIDGRIDRALSNDSENAMVVSLIVQRLARLSACQGGETCLEPADGNKLNYRLMLALATQPKEGDPAIERLQRTHEAYLAWQSDPRIIKEIYSKDLERIRDWSRRGRLTVGWVLESTKDLTPIRASGFWGFNSPGEVAGSYTAQAWKEGISPLISGFQKMAIEPEFAAALKRFTDDYRSAALKEWDKFLTKIPEGETVLVAKGIAREQGARMLSSDSPFYRAIDVANANLSVIEGDVWQEGNLQPWAAMLKRYGAMKAKLQAGGESGKPAAAEKNSQKDDPALKYVTMYLDAVSEFRADLSTPDKAFKSAQKAFQEGDVSSKATHPLLKASWALGVMRDSVGARQGGDEEFWILLERPLALAWRSMLVEAGNQLQEQWYKLRLGVSKQLEQDPAGVAEKVYGFALEGPAAPFLVQGGRWESRKIFKQGIEFNDAFLRYLSQLRGSATGGATGSRPGFADDLPRDIVKSN
ncbi:MAG TPA: type VI secretion protein IcmF/TssM N-terminal domain-containing protein [Candidatus Binatia bacterium]